MENKSDIIEGVKGKILQLKSRIYHIEESDNAIYHKSYRDSSGNYYVKKEIYCKLIKLFGIVIKFRLRQRSVEFDTTEKEDRIGLR